jgi:N6-L-threonylcarbamoyladenine synthase
VLVIAIETSCDETSAAVVKNGREVLSNIVATQVDFHKKYGGIVPEVAARKHIEVITLVIQEALDQAKIKFKDLDAVAVTYGPGLIGSLLVGVCAAKAIAYAMDIPLIGVNHLAGHIAANYLAEIPNPKLQIPKFPFVCLLVSGGHTSLVLVKGHGKHKVLGQTRDDAAGEAFDKIARFLKLGYPGGPIIDKLAKEGDPTAINFKRPMIEEEFGYDFSFSGLKTGVVNFIKKQETATLSRRFLADLVSSFQQAAVDVLVDKTIRAAKEYKCRTICLAGGVAANSRLRQDLKEKGGNRGLAVKIPPLEYCTDNAAMIACAAYYKLRTRNSRLLDLSPVASLGL